MPRFSARIIPVYLLIVASLSGPTPIHFTGTPAAISIILAYLVTDGFSVQFVEG